ncbi:MAG TPA: hypothetical protein VFQ45_17220 [Longimicrobium sp.]|nr:hypothetical protein [Longimicrobium sp.]
MTPAADREELITRYLAADDYTPALTWRLLDWCMARGADALTLDPMRMVGRPSPACDAFETRMAPHRLADGERRPLGAPYEQWREPAELWRLDAASAAILREHLELGLFTYLLDPENGWLEDPALYRGRELMLGVVTHEGEGFLRVTAGERAELDGLGFPTRDAGTWI